MIKAFIFDFDGLIIDTELSCYDTWQDIYKQFNTDIPLSEWIKCVGGDNSKFDPIIYLKSKTNLLFDEEKIQKEQLKKHQERSASMPILPGVISLIKYAKENELKLAVASSSSFRWVSYHLKHKKIFDYFDTIITADDVNKVKPAPDLFLKAKENLGISDFEGIVFEDSAHGIHAATEANLYTVAAPNQITKFSDFSNATLIVNTLDEISPENIIKNLSDNHKKR